MGSAVAIASRAHWESCSSPSTTYSERRSSGASSAIAWYSRASTADVDDGVAEAPHARPVQPGLEREPEDVAARGPLRLEDRVGLRGHGQVPLAAEVERL